MAEVKRSPNRTENWDLAMAHSRGGIVHHSFSERFKTGKRSFVGASWLGKWPRVLTAARGRDASRTDCSRSVSVSRRFIKRETGVGRIHRAAYARVCDRLGRTAVLSP